jgi:nickel transport protein
MFRKTVLSILMTFFATQLVLAHDTWIEKRNGQLLVLRGHHGGAIEAYDPELVREAKALDAKGQAVPVEIVKNKENVSLSPKGNPAIVGAFYDSGCWLKTTDGWKKATKREGKDTYTIVQSLRAKQWCKSFTAPSVESSKPMGQRFEVVPQKDPTTLSVGEKLPIKVVLDGKPVEGAIITTGGGHESDKKDPLKTDKAGMASISVERPGLQMAKANYKIPTKDDPDADELSLSSTITFVAP